MHSVRRATSRLLDSPPFVLLLILVVVALFLFRTPQPFSHDDALRHVVMGRALWGHWSVAVARGWSLFLYDGMLSTYRTDPWFLADVLLVPFSFFPTVTAVKLFTLFQLLSVGGAFLLLLHSWRLPRRDTVTLLLLFYFGHPLFLSRMFLGRPFTLQTALFILVLWAIFERRIITMALFLALSVLVSQLFLFPLLLVLSAVVWYWWDGRRAVAWKMAVAACVGVFVGLALHPGSLAYGQYLLRVFVWIPWQIFHLRMGGEMIPTNLFSSVLIGMGVCTASLFLIAGALTSPPRQGILLKEGIVFLAILCTVTFITFRIWQRSIDILWPLLLAFNARILVVFPGSPRVVMERILPLGIGAKVRKTLLRTVLAITAVTLFLREGAQEIESFRIPTSVPSGAHILNVEWAAIPGFLTWRPDLLYARGIDATFTAFDDPMLSVLIGDTASRIEAKTVTNPTEWFSILTAGRQADYIVIMKKNEKFLSFLRSVPGLREGEGTADLAVFKVLVPWGGL